MLSCNNVMSLSKLISHSTDYNYVKSIKLFDWPAGIDTTQYYKHKAADLERTKVMNEQLL